jgi:hypothetical protein
MGGDLDHATGVARGADAAALAREGDQALGAGLAAAGAGEAVGQDATAQVGAEVVFGPPGNAFTPGIRVGRPRKEALQVVLDDGVERGGGGLAAAVDGVKPEPGRVRLPAGAWTWEAE